MNIIVCIKQVPDTNEVRIDQVKGTLIRDGVPSIINPDDKNALEEAIKIKEQYKDVNVTVLSMGPPQAEIALREALSMGADEAVLLSDRQFGGSDTWGTSVILAAAIKKIGKFDLIFCGRQAIDGDTAQVGPEVAEHLGLPQITYVSNLEIQGEEVTAKRIIEDGYYIIKSKMPVLLTTIKELNTPRYSSLNGIYKAFREKKITIWGADDIEADMSNAGLKGSPTNVKKSFTPIHQFSAEIITGTAEEAAYKLGKKIREKQIG